VRVVLKIPKTKGQKLIDLPIFKGHYQFPACTTTRQLLDGNRAPARQRGTFLLPFCLTLAAKREFALEQRGLSLT